MLPPDPLNRLFLCTTRRVVCINSARIYEYFFVRGHRHNCICVRLMDPGWQLYCMLVYRHIGVRKVAHKRPCTMTTTTTTTPSNRCGVLFQCAIRWLIRFSCSILCGLALYVGTARTFSVAQSTQKKRRPLTFLYIAHCAADAAFFFFFFLS